MAVKFSGDISAESARGQKIEEQVVTDLDAHDDENRPSSTSSAVAEERKGVSSKNTIDEIADAITGGNDIGLWVLGPVNVPEKLQEYWLKYETDSFVMKSLFQNMMFNNREKLETCHGYVPQVLSVARTTMTK